MQLFYTPDITLPLYNLPEEESKHAVKVLRAVVGDELHMTDGKGNLYKTKVVAANPKQCIVEIVETKSEFEKRNYHLTMAVAPTKNIDRYEWFLEKATEVGVDRFIPMECRNSERKTIKRERAERVITSAVKQSLKAYHPKIDELTSFKEVVKMPFDGVKLIAYCGDGEKKTINECVLQNSNTLILIGPEGDFSPQEVETAISHGFIPITLGTMRLRTETAALFSVINISLRSSER